MQAQSMFIAEVIEQTKAGQLNWSVISNGAYSHLIHQAPLVFRSYEANFQKAGRSYRLVLVEKRGSSMGTRVDSPESKYRCELLVIEKAVAILTLDNTQEGAGSLLTLAHLLGSQNATAAKEFLSLFSSP